MLIYNLKHFNETKYLLRSPLPQHGFNITVGVKSYSPPFSEYSYCESECSNSEL